MVSPMAANAHDELLSTVPASGAELETAPTEIRLSFSDDILELGAVSQVLDAAGKNWAAGDMAANGRDGVQPLEANMPAGDYEVRWRVVSSDGHPISDAFTFAVGPVAAADPEPEPAPAPAPVTEAPAQNQTPAPASSPNHDAATDASAVVSESASPPFLLIGIGGALAGIAILALVLWMAKRHRMRA
jgi:hypothetical protein